MTTNSGHLKRSGCQTNLFGSCQEASLSAHLSALKCKKGEKRRGVSIQVKINETIHNHFFN